MKIKNIYFGLLLIIAFIFNACEENEVTLNEPSHRVIVTSEMDYDNQIEVNGTISFGDISTGVESRTWTFPEGIVNILSEENAGNTSSKPTVKTMFTEAGEYNVNLNQIFKDNAFVEETLMGKELDTTIVITVFDQVSASIEAFHINEDGTTGEALNITENAENEVTASKSIRFTYTVDGNPFDFNWTLEGADPETDDSGVEELDVKYKKLGTYDVEFIASRGRPYGGDTISLKNLIKVIPSTDPVDLEKITEENGKIALVFSREMDAFTLNKDNFSVTVENGGTNIPVTISKASIHETEGNIVLIELDGDRVYNNDIVKVSYTPGILMTTDAVAATAFTDVVLEFETYNILKDTDFDYSFENSTATQWPYLWWGGNWGMYDLEVSSTNAQDGSQSAYIEYHENGGMIIGHNDIGGNAVEVPIKAGQAYEFGVWIYVTEDFVSDPYPLTDAFESDIRIYPSDWTFEALVTTFDAEFPVGEWVYTNAFVNGAADANVNFFIRGYNVGTDKRLKFYMDNLSVAEVALRP